MASTSPPWACSARGALGCKEVEFNGQIRPHNKLVRYEVEIRRFTRMASAGTAVAIGSGKVLVDGEQIYSVRDAKVGMFQGIAYSDYPAPGKNSLGGRVHHSGDGQ